MSAILKWTLCVKCAIILFGPVSRQNTLIDIYGIRHISFMYFFVGHWSLGCILNLARPTVLRFALQNGKISTTKKLLNIFFKIEFQYNDQMSSSKTLDKQIGQFLGGS